MIKAFEAKQVLVALRPLTNDHCFEIIEWYDSYAFRASAKKTLLSLQTLLCYFHRFITTECKQMKMNCSLIANVTANVQKIND